MCNLLTGIVADIIRVDMHIAEPSEKHRSHWRTLSHTYCSPTVGRGFGTQHNGFCGRAIFCVCVWVCWYYCSENCCELYLFPLRICTPCTSPTTGSRAERCNVAGSFRCSGILGRLHAHPARRRQRRRSSISNECNNASAPNGTAPHRSAPPKHQPPSKNSHLTQNETSLHFTRLERLVAAWGRQQTTSRQLFNYSRSFGEHCTHPNAIPHCMAANEAAVADAAICREW